MHKNIFCFPLHPILLLIAMLFLTACAGRPPIPASNRQGSWLEHQNRVKKIDIWEFKGRIALQLDNEAWSAGLFWQQQQDDYLVRLFAPLGSGTYELSGNASGVTLRTAKQEILHADDAQTLLQENLGWQVPLSGLIYWVRGLPEPGISTRTIHIDDRGRLHYLDQSGWQISFERYDSVNEYELPAKISLQNNRLKIRLVIKTWVLSI